MLDTSHTTGVAALPMHQWLDSTHQNRKRQNSSLAQIEVGFDWTGTLWYGM